MVVELVPEAPGECTYGVDRVRGSLIFEEADDPSPVAVALAGLPRDSLHDPVRRRQSTSQAFPRVIAVGFVDAPSSPAERLPLLQRLWPAAPGARSLGTVERRVATITGTVRFSPGGPAAGPVQLTLAGPSRPVIWVYDIERGDRPRIREVR